MGGMTQRPLVQLRDGAVRGKAESGDKTMVDALTPAVTAAKTAADNGGGVGEVLAAAAAAATAGAEATIPLQARKGRASYLGERSIGHPDPGATSTGYLLQALAATANGEPVRMTVGLVLVSHSRELANGLASVGPCHGDSKHRSVLSGDVRVAR